MVRPIADALKQDLLLNGPFTTYRKKFRTTMAESILTGHIQTELVTNTIKGLLRSIAYSAVDSGMKPMIENRLKGRIKK